VYRYPFIVVLAVINSVLVAVDPPVAPGLETVEMFTVSGLASRIHSNPAAMLPA